MKHMTLERIAQACHGTFYGSEDLKSAEITGVAIDSRKIKKDYLFVPIKGARADGHDFIPQVLASGALCVLSEKTLPEDQMPYILVDSCFQALKDIAEYYRNQLDITVIGITGSVGKTSTKEMIASVLSEKYNVLKTEGNFNNEIGLPLTVFQLTEEHEVAILEMGISDFGEMHRLAKIARPDICVITNIGPCHLEQLGDLDGVLRAKSEIFDYLEPKGQIILNGDDATLKTVTKARGIKPLFFGLAPTLDVYAEKVQSMGLDGTSCFIHLDNKILKTEISIPGQHMVYNALAGAAVGAALALSDSQIIEGIKKLVPVDGRNKQIKTDNYTLIDDCYNANPVSMKAALDVLQHASGRTVAILGDMGELGADADKYHREVGSYAKANKIDVIICIGTLAEHLAAGAGVDTTPECVYHFDSKAEFIDHYDKILLTGDTILIKASHSMEFEKIVDFLKDVSI